MSYFKVLKQFREKQIPQVILLYGTESYFIQNLRKELLHQVLNGDGDNLSTYDLEETPIEEVISDAETYPFFGEKKLIIVHNPYFLTAKQMKLPFDHDVKRLEQYIANPVDYSILVFIAPYEKLDNRKKITKIFRDQALVAECNPVKDYELNKWIKNIADDLNIKIAPNAYEVFEAELMTNLYLIQNELMKLSSFVGENGVVTKEIAEQLISHTENSSSLRLVDAVIDRNIARAISIYNDLKKMNEEPIAIIALLAYQFRMIFQVKLLKGKGYSQYQIQKQIGAHAYVIKIASNRERQFTVKKLKYIINQLTNTDAAIKQGKIEQDIAFEMLLYDLIYGETVNSEASLIH